MLTIQQKRSASELFLAAFLLRKPLTEASCVSMDAAVGLHAAALLLHVYLLLEGKPLQLQISFLRAEQICSGPPGSAPTQEPGAWLWACSFPSMASLLC